MKLSPAQKLTLAGILALGAATTVWDLWLLFNGEPGDTISSVVRTQDWSAGAIGYIAAHLVQRTKPREYHIPGWVSLGGGFLAVFASQVYGGGIFGMILGFGLGWALWKNDGTS